MKKQLFILIVLGLALMSCNNDVQTVITVKLNPSFITLSEGNNEPMKMKTVVTATDSVVYAIQVYENDAPYYFGLFNDVSKMQLALTTSKTYKFKVSAYKTGTGKGLRTVTDADGINYYFPNKIALKNMFIKGDALKYIDLASSAVLNGQIKDYPEEDIFYSTKSLTLDKGTTSIDFTLLRMGFGINFSVDALNSGTMEIYVGNDTLKLNSTKTSTFTIRQYNTATNTFANILSNTDTFGDSIAVSAKWTSASGTSVSALGKYKFSRNYKKTINIQLNTMTNNFNFEGWNIAYDIDGNVYHTVTIGTQTWMAENLKVTHYRDGTAIPNITNATSWSILTTGAYCDYNNTPSNSTTNGRLYNWYAATDLRNIAPVGWHVASDSEWTVFENYLIAKSFNFDNSIIGNKIAKSLSSKTNWNTNSNIGAIGNDLSINNRSGFSALPSGVRVNSTALDDGINTYCHFVTSTEISSTNCWYRGLGYDNNFLSRDNLSKKEGTSIRCVKD